MCEQTNIQVKGKNVKNSGTAIFKILITIINKQICQLRKNNGM